MLSLGALLLQLAAGAEVASIQGAFEADGCELRGTATFLWLEARQLLQTMEIFMLQVPGADTSHWLAKGPNVRLSRASTRTSSILTRTETNFLYGSQPTKLACTDVQDLGSSGESPARSATGNVGTGITQPGLSAARTRCYWFEHGAIGYRHS